MTIFRIAILNNLIGSIPDSLYTGALLVDFQYEVGNDQFLNAQAIETGEPENNMMAILLDSTEALVEQVVADTYGRRGLRLAEVRNLRVTYASKTTAIQNLTDICELYDLPRCLQSNDYVIFDKTTHCSPF